MITHPLKMNFKAGFLQNHEEYTKRRWRWFYKKTYRRDIFCRRVRRSAFALLAVPVVESEPVPKFVDGDVLSYHTCIDGSTIRVTAQSHSNRIRQSRPSTMEYSVDQVVKDTPLCFSFLRSRSASSCSTLQDSYNEMQARDICVELIGALRYCHERNIVHRDVKSKNILLSSGGGDATIKLSDFGLACSVARRNVITPLRTPGFSAPEILLGKRHDTVSGEVK